MARLPRLVHNRLSYLGAGIAGLALILFVFLFVLHSFTGAAQAPYAGLIIFVFVPAILIFGLGLIPIGMLVEWRQLRRTGVRSIPRFPIVDLNDASQRNAVAIFAVGSIVFLFLSVFGSFQAYEATESVSFCGTLCHAVMAPEFTAYENSPHARVRCVDCHVGPGADWYVKSKLSGSYQVYAVLFDKYPRPIPVPISNLRPAQQTCEQCHWPKQFFGGQQKKMVHFLPDENNTRWEINMLIKTGGGSPATGLAEGIHWHMNIANHVEYIATDAQRQDIPWVRITDVKTGKSTEYMSTENPLSKAQIRAAAMRTMDCMDCHNRPTHIFRSPSYSLNLALETGAIDAALPFIKKEGVEMLAADYASTQQASQAIDAGLRKFYQDKYPEVMTRRPEAVSQAVDQLQRIYRQSFFPYMKVRWDVYADNIGHLMSAGCYRCHDGEHKSADGKVITKECTACHTIMAQGSPPNVAFATGPDGLGFQHPEDIGGAWQQMKCDECHTGENP